MVERDDLVADHDRPTDPELPHVHTPAEVDAMETVRDKLDDASDRVPWLKWTALAVGICMVAGAIIRSCWAP